MARAAIPVTTLTANGAVLNQAGTTIASFAATGGNIALNTTTIPATAFDDRVVIYVQNTTAATATVTIRAGDNTTSLNVPAFEAGKGDFTTGNLTANTGTAFIGPLLASRFTQSGAAGSDQPAGSINIDVTPNTTTGFVWALLLPRAF